MIPVKGRVIFWFGYSGTRTVFKQNNNLKKIPVMNNLKPIVAGICLLSAFPAMAQDSSKTDSLRTETLVPVEITAIRVNDKSPFATTTLHEADIRRNNTGRDIPYLLDQTPSVVANSDAGTGIGYTDMRIRGTDNARINFTLNGIPLNDAESQGTFFVDFPDLMSSAHSIQVQRGVGSSTNGSGAFGASVNISNTEQADSASAELFNSYGSFQAWRNLLRAGTGQLGSGFRFDLRLSRQTSDGYIYRSYAQLKSLQFLAGWYAKNGKTQIKFNLLSGTERTGQAWNGVPEDSLKTNRRYNELGLKADGSYYDDQSDNYRQDYYQLFVHHKLNPYWKLNGALFLTRGKGFYNEYKSDEGFAGYGLPDFITPSGDTFSQTNLTRKLWLDNYYYGLTGSVGYNRNKTDLIIGGSALQYDARHYGDVTWADYGVPNDYRWYQLTAFKNDLNLFAKWQQRLTTHIYFFADLQFRDVQYTINGFRKNPDITIREHFSFLNPKFGLSYLKSHAGSMQSKAYVSFAMAGKEPNRDDFEAAPADLPLPEKLYDAEAGYQFRKPGLDIGAGLYYMYYTNQLIATGKINDVGAYARTNVPNSFRAGIELTLQAKAAGWLDFYGNATLSQNKITRFTEYYDDYDTGGQTAVTHSNTDIALSPNTIVTGGVVLFPFYQLQAERYFQISLNGKHIGRQYLDNTSNMERSIAAYTVFNTQIRYGFHTKWISELGVMFSVNNIFNKLYESKGYTYSYQYDGVVITANYYYPQAGTNWMFGLSLKW